MPKALGSNADGKVPDSATELTAAITVSAVSTSVTVKEPVVVRVVSVSVRAARSPALVSLAEITAVSLVPVMVRVTVSLSLRGMALLSVTVTV